MPLDSEYRADADGKPIPCISRRYEGNEKTLLDIVRTLASDNVVDYVKSFIDNFPSKVPQYEFN